MNNISMSGLLVCLLLWTGCNNNPYDSSPIYSNGDSNQQDEIIPIETDMSISPDRKYIYYILANPEDNSRNGIYRAQIVNPARELILTGIGYRSPTLSFDNNTIAYLEGFRIRYLNLAENSISSSSIQRSFSSILFVNEDHLIACWKDTIFVVNEVDGIISTIPNRRDPTLYDRDYYICFTDVDNYNYYIIKDNFEESSPETLHSIGVEVWPHWPSIDPVSGQLLYTLEYFLTPKYIYTAKSGSFIEPGNSLNLIDSTGYDKPYIINKNLIIYSGPDGQFYKNDYTGHNPAPFTYTKDEHIPGGGNNKHIIKRPEG
jgi:hypothetical protein